MSTFTVSTKVDASSEAVKTALTIDFSEVTREQLEAIATQAIVVKWQSQVRRAGIPSEAKIDARQYTPGTRAVQAPVNILQMVTKMTAEEKQRLLEKLQATE